MAAAATGFLPVDGFLLAFQAAGLIIDYKTTKDNKRLIQQGRMLEQAEFESNLEAIRLESAEASLAEMKDLRQNIGTQIAMNAARGTSSGAGSAFTNIQESISTAGTDERVRKMNLLAKEASLRGQNVVSSLKSLQSETQLGQAMTKRFVEAIGSTSNIDAFRRSSLGKKWGFGLETVE